jgi:hypothetical protein
MSYRNLEEILLKRSAVTSLEKVEVYWILLEIHVYLVPNFTEFYLVGFHLLSVKITWNLVVIRTEKYLVRFQQNKGKIQEICTPIIIIRPLDNIIPGCTLNRTITVYRKTMESEEIFDDECKRIGLYRIPHVT